MPSSPDQSSKNASEAKLTKKKKKKRLEIKSALKNDLDNARKFKLVSEG